MPKLVAAGVDVNLDFGFWRRADRDEARRVAEAAGGAVRLYSLECEDAVAIERCNARNLDPHASFFIDENAYHHLRDLRRFEPIAPDEAAERIDTTSRRIESG